MGLQSPQGRKETPGLGCAVGLEPRWFLHSGQGEGVRHGHRVRTSRGNQELCRALSQAGPPAALSHPHVAVLGQPLPFPPVCPLTHPCAATGDLCVPSNTVLPRALDHCPLPPPSPSHLCPITPCATPEHLSLLPLPSPWLGGTLGSCGLLPLSGSSQAWAVLSLQRREQREGV